ncbi:uncharacterized protein LOC103507491 [Diaphorina citri]|uniref:Uncharacterized protein LOC103507491 n=1 Tax=Diaphorina citri TaxID=121845 RepID=A0A1S3CY50_DIACI|nr:uncharacterized protein LOC103507491 [Diaphorina citri]
MDNSSSSVEYYDDSQNIFAIDELCSAAGNTLSRFIPADSVSDEIVIKAAESVVHDCELLELSQSPPPITVPHVFSNEMHHTGQHLPDLHEVSNNREQDETLQYNDENETQLIEQHLPDLHEVSNNSEQDETLQCNAENETQLTGQHPDLHEVSNSAYYATKY